MLGNLIKDLPEDERPKPKKQKNTYTSPWGNPGGKKRQSFNFLIYVYANI